MADSASPGLGAPAMSENKGYAYTSEGMRGEADYSDTNVQVENVDEGDIIKTDGEYIYRLFGGDEIAIIRADDLALMSKIKVERDSYTDYKNSTEMYVEGDRLVVISGYNVYFDGSEQLAPQDYYDRMEQFWEDHDGEDTQSSLRVESRTSADVYDITDRAAPSPVNTLSQSGSYVSSRMVEGFIYIVTDEYIHNNISLTEPSTYIPTVRCGDASNLIAPEDIYVFDEAEQAAYTIVTAVDVLGGTQHTSAKAVLGRAGSIYADADSLLVAASHRRQNVEELSDDKGAYTLITEECDTKIVLFSFLGGEIEQKASGVIEGSLLNQFSMDEHDGFYRFVTTDSTGFTKIYTEGIDSYEYSDEQTNGLYILSDSLTIVGKIDKLAENERVYSVRFDGDIAYFVTFRQTDPLFTVDVSDPTAPKILSELKIPGFSEYLHKYSEGRLFGLGYDADEEGVTDGMKLSMFDVSDPTAVSEKTTLGLDAYWSEALHNHKAIVISPQRDIIALPLEDGYTIFGYSDEQGFYRRAEMKFEGSWGGDMRGLFIGEHFYVVDASRAAKYSMTDFAKLDEVVFNEDGEEYILY
ncbi:MAG: beta-propeller domain-containing protein, partial [Clostridia bacterium]|nr:beta-propeller domain-containing protein [Clostridia bacterium]